MEDTTSPTFGMNRRELLKRGAVVGALTWAAPAISSLGSPAFASHGTPAAISYVLIVFECEGTRYKIKWDHGDGFQDCTHNNPSCEQTPTGWDGATCWDTSTQGPVPLDVTEANCTICFTVDCTNGLIVDGLAVDGQAFGCIEENSNDGSTICFDDPDCS